MKHTILIGIIVLAMVFGVVAYATAEDSNTVTINAQALPKLTISAAPGTLTFSNAVPEVESAPQTVGVEVKSNKLYSLTSNATGDITEMGLARTLADHAAKDLGRGTTTYDDDITVTMPYDSDADTVYSASVIYTALQ